MFGTLFMNYVLCHTYHFDWFVILKKANEKIVSTESKTFKVFNQIYNTGNMNTLSLAFITQFVSILQQ